MELAEGQSLGSRHPSAVAVAVVHELPIVAVMIWVAVSGHSVLVCVGAALLLAALAIVYAPLARARGWARAHLVDLGAMALVMVVPVWSGHGGASSVEGGAGVGGASAGGGPAVHDHGPVTLDAGLVLGVVVLAWAAARVVLAGAERRRGVSLCVSLWASGSVLTAVVCAAGLAWMLLR